LLKTRREPRLKARAFSITWRHHLRGLERVHDLFMGVRARLRAVCVVARNSQAIAVVCASQPIPNRIPHTFIRDHG
jgi:hypothetical protein